ncbi:hypothetical protein J4463_01200 [Candidatus Pacearchaeota archaeon]|nr:hypothetical protein [Candidatus Pacearchaeota archaeon]
MKFNSQRGARQIYLLLILSFIFLVSMFQINFASAQFFGRNFGGFSLEEGFRQLEPTISFVLGDVGGDMNIVFIKFLIFLLILAICVVALKRVPGINENPQLGKILSVIIALMAARYLTAEELIQFIWLPYGVLGIALSSLLPLIIFFFFIESLDSTVLRKFGWTAFGVIYFFLAAMRWTELEAEPFNLGWIYIAVAAISIIALAFDKTIREAIIVGAIKAGYDMNDIVNKAELSKELERVQSALASPYISGAEARKLKKKEKNLEDAIRRLK